jgi:hypothetical protein
MRNSMSSIAGSGGACYFAKFRCEVDSNPHDRRESVESTLSGRLGAVVTTEKTVTGKADDGQRRP